jgi:exonuclease III
MKQSIKQLVVYYAIIVTITLLVVWILTNTYRYIKSIKHQDGLRICSWNVEWFGLPKNKDMFSEVNNMPLYDKTIENMRDVNYHIQVINPDIISFQEVADLTTIEVYKNTIQDYDIFYKPDMLRNGNQFNVFMVKKHINVIKFDVIDEHHKVIRIDFSYNSDIISLYNVHLKADYEGNFAQVREKQIQYLYTYITDPDNYNVNSILTGDFNARPGSYEMKIIDDKFINVLFTDKSDLNLESKYSLWIDENQDSLMTKEELALTDYFFVSDRVYDFVNKMYINKILYQKLFTVDVNNKISDHYPIILDMI